MKEVFLICLKGNFLCLLAAENEGGAATARNIGVKFSRGQVLVFLDADCRVSSSWLTTHLKEHERNSDKVVVGGSIRIEKKSSFWVRCDHYCSWYNVHPYHKEKWVPNHPAANMSMSRFTFDRELVHLKKISSKMVYTKRLNGKTVYLNWEDVSCLNLLLR